MSSILGSVSPPTNLFPFPSFLSVFLLPSFLTFFLLPSLSFFSPLLFSLRSNSFHLSTADPDHPDSALNAIPKAVLQNAKGLAVFSVVKAVSAKFFFYFTSIYKTSFRSLFGGVDVVEAVGMWLRKERGEGSKRVPLRNGSWG